ncbi:hypothetical protein Micbo1qcDRAFT_202774 [Microdochium bolleyi]|uniref:2EXR domain-containing protein n=1 Tax=Microdochium bolleyi TaxID=196109 RepID=A0A136J6C1_9PEZI|nr:hypothetical protein Micbo1qcDRAFT_202774 [Microdochium bolleyi]
MAVTTFHPFPRLPPELRQMIYAASIQPRVVHVQERHECRASFLERFRTSVLPATFQLDDGIGFFAPVWPFTMDAEMESTTVQTTLDMYGFRTTRTLERPEPIDETAPEVTLGWLLDKPHIAWEFMRESSLLSRAPIPVLLHVCRETRAALRTLGYHLAFATRSSEGMTWFHYDFDTLYLKPTAPGSRPSVMSGHSWDIGQFMPEDLLRVKRLALSGAETMPFLPEEALYTFTMFVFPVPSTLQTDAVVTMITI